MASAHSKRRDRSVTWLCSRKSVVLAHVVHLRATLSLLWYYMRNTCILHTMRIINIYVSNRNPSTTLLNFCGFFLATK